MAGRYYPQKDIDTFDKFNKELIGNLATGQDGIINPNIYCYMISVFQSLKSCKIFLLYLNKYVSDVSKESTKNYSLLKSLNDILNGGRPDLEDFIIEFDNYITTNNIPFNHTIVNDAGEFFNILLQMLDNTENISSIQEYYNKYPDNIGNITDKRIIKEDDLSGNRTPINYILNKIYSFD